MNNYMKIAIFLSIVSLICFLSLHKLENKNTMKTDCYDNKGSKIVGLECEKLIGCDSLLCYILVIVGIASIVAAFGSYVLGLFGYTY